MPHIDKHKPGLELGTTDQNAAKQFYGSLLRWQFHYPMGPEGVYTVFKIDGKDAAPLVIN
jgi:predicted enzyme related to lactoylglutathione lyase